MPSDSSPALARLLISPCARAHLAATNVSITMAAAMTWSDGYAPATITAMYSGRFLLLKVSWKKATP